MLAVTSRRPCRCGSLPINPIPILFFARVSSIFREAELWVLHWKPCQGLFRVPTPGFIYIIMSPTLSHQWIPHPPQQSLNIFRELAIAGECQGFDLSWTRKCSKSLTVLRL